MARAARRPGSRAVNRPSESRYSIRLRRRPGASSWGSRTGFGVTWGRRWSPEKRTRLSSCHRLRWLAACPGVSTTVHSRPPAARMSPSPRDSRACSAGTWIRAWFDFRRSGHWSTRSFGHAQVDEEGQVLGRPVTQELGPFGGAAEDRGPGAFGHPAGGAVVVGMAVGDEDLLDVGHGQGRPRRAAPRGRPATRGSSSRGRPA